MKNLPTVFGKYRAQARLGDSTWFGVGGSAEVLYRPADTNDLANFLSNVDKSINITTLGLCSNVIIRDSGINGVVIKLGKAFTNIHIDDNTVTARCAVTDYNLAHLLVEYNLSGLEFLSGVPGSIGGAVAMNAGCYGTEISECLLHVEGVEKSTGKIYILPAKSLGLSYRHNNLAEEFIFTNATFKLQRVDNSTKISDKIELIKNMRSNSQPIKEKTGGSTFKNLPDKKAWELIDESSMRGYKHGGAEVSAQHCNFLINSGDATAADLEDLGELIRERVLKDTGRVLEWEIKRIGVR